MKTEIKNKDNNWDRMFSICVVILFIAIPHLLYRDYSLSSRLTLLEWASMSAQEKCEKRGGEYFKYVPLEFQSAWIINPGTPDEEVLDKTHCFFIKKGIQGKYIQKNYILTDNNWVLFNSEEILK